MMKAFYNFITFMAALVVLGWAGWEVYLHVGMFTAPAAVKAGACACKACVCKCGCDKGGKCECKKCVCDCGCAPKHHEKPDCGGCCK